MLLHPLLPDIILTGLGVLVIVVDLMRVKTRVLRFITVVGLVSAFLSCITLIGSSFDVLYGALRVDGFAVFFKCLFVLVAGLITFISPRYLERHHIPTGEFYSLLVFATLGAGLMASSLDLLTIYVSLELLSLASYVLTGLSKDDTRSSEAALKYFLFGAMTSGIILFGMSLVYAASGSTHLVDVAQALTNPGSASYAIALSGMLFLFVGFGVKVAAVPFHMWVPDAYEGAPTPVAGYLIAVSEAAAFASLIRIFFVGLSSFEEHWRLVFSVIAAITMTFGNVAAITQSNIKRMMAYSAVAQAGYVLVGMAVADASAIGAMLFYLFAYAFMTVGAFAVITSLADSPETEQISAFRGLWQRSPLAAAALAVYFLSLIGVPPTAGFLAKFGLFKAAVGSGLTWLGLLVVLNSVISFPYYYGVVRQVYFHSGSDESSYDRVAISGGMGLALGVTLVAILALGVYPEPLLRLISVLQAPIR